MGEGTNLSNTLFSTPIPWPSDTSLELVVLPWSGWELKVR